MPLKKRGAPKTAHPDESGIRNAILKARAALGTTTDSDNSSIVSDESADANPAFATGEETSARRGAIVTPARVEEAFGETVEDVQKLMLELGADLQPEDTEDELGNYGSDASEDSLGMEESGTEAQAAVLEGVQESRKMETAPVKATVIKTTRKSGQSKLEQKARPVVAQSLKARSERGSSQSLSAPAAVKKGVVPAPRATTENAKAQKTPGDLRKTVKAGLSAPKTASAQTGKAAAAKKPANGAIKAAGAGGKDSGPKKFKLGSRARRALKGGVQTQGREGASPAAASTKHSEEKPTEAKPVVKEQRRRFKNSGRRKRRREAEAAAS